MYTRGFHDFLSLVIDKMPTAIVASHSRVFALSSITFGGAASVIHLFLRGFLGLHSFGSSKMRLVVRERGWGAAGAGRIGV